jgi:formylmethanofuran dehydrogenase subunit C
MMQKWTIIICGDAAEALGDSMYAGRIFVGGSITELGNDAVTQELMPEDLEFLISTLARYEVTSASSFKKVVAAT